MKSTVANPEQAAIEQQCRALHLPAVADQCVPLADEATRQRQTHLRYLEALLAAEMEEHERNTITQRIKGCPTVPFSRPDTLPPFCEVPDGSPIHSRSFVCSPLTKNFG